MEHEVGREIDLHAVKRIAEVRASAVNDLLEAGWILHDLYFTSEGDYHSRYILLSLEEPRCPRCQAPARVEILDGGERVRYVCTRECS
ncbi:MAG: hypothetical protein ACP5VE_12315 [Chthonomonadales bacterium]